ncbi:PREDICTED: protein rolling stone-like [Branchiostoma belcheri]|uniref:Protein rolling stone-like n=1 Tax=Branchiostoma belcheri TaxID=7741 RepID=A0A6P4YTI0_BRABE|nr:PREDICTED: protein rolling stone-like [Branchiostoma belcheri]
MSPCRDECSPRLRYHDRSVFSRSPWCSGQVAFVLYRILMALVAVTILMYLLCHFYITDGWTKWPVYLNNWCFSVLTLHTVVAMAVSAAVYCRSDYTEFSAEATRDENVAPNSLNWYHKVHWVLHSTSITMAFLVTTLYWAFDKRELVATSINEHILNSVLALLDLFVSGTPVRVFHMVYPVAFAMAYSAFYVIYWAAGGTGKSGEIVLYKLWDFEGNLKMAVVYMVLMVFVATPFFHLLTYGLHRLKILILAKTLGSDAGAASPLRRGQRDYKLYVETAL